MVRTWAALALSSLWLAGCGQIVGIRTLTTSPSATDDGGPAPSLTCEASSCCEALQGCCGSLSAYPSVQTYCLSAVDAGYEPECAELLDSVYRPECP